MLTQNMHVRVNRDGVTSRRTFLQQVVVGTAAGTVLPWVDLLRVRAADLRARGMSCIVLFMQGGPSQFETFDPKPGTDTGGPTQAIDTAVPGIRIAEGWENIAREMKDIALIRSMVGTEGNHQRAVYQLHTGYVPSGSVKHPSLGAIAACELGDPAFDLPHYVSIGGRFRIGSGFLGMSYAPFVVTNPNSLPANVALPNRVDRRRFVRRLKLMADLEQDFAKAGGEARVEDHRSIYRSAASLVVSPRLKAFDLSQEKDSVRDQYGRTTFGQGCLLARRLVETGVTFVEVSSNGWDTHNDNFERTKTLAGQVDPAFAHLIRDLRQRGLLEKTLVVWMGEFGRTPRINGRTGRDHYPRAFTVALAGAGIQGGRVIGSTTEDGRTIADRPVSVADLFCTFCKALGINPRKENMSGVGRPIKIVDGGNPVSELFA